MAEAFIGAGDVWINPQDPANPTNYLGWVGPIEASKFEPKANSTIKEVKSKSRDKYGQVIGSVALQDPAEITVTLAEATAANLAMLFSGDVVSITAQTGSTVTGEAGTLRTSGGLALAKQGLTTAPVVVHGGGTAYVEGTDYAVNRRMGLVSVIAGSTLATAVAAATITGLAVTTDYVAGAIGGTRVRGNTQPRLKAWLKFDGINQLNGRAVICEVWQAVLTPNAGFDFLADNAAELPLTGRMETPTGKTEPFVVDYRA